MSVDTSTIKKQLIRHNRIKNFLSESSQKELLSEAKGGPTDKLLDIDGFLYVAGGASVTDVLTLTRVLRGVAVVGMPSHSLRPKHGKIVIPVSIKYLPAEGGLDENLEALAKEIKTINEVKLVKFTKINDRDYKKSDGTPWVF